MHGHLRWLRRASHAAQLATDSRPPRLGFGALLLRLACESDAGGSCRGLCCTNAMRWHEVVPLLPVPLFAKACRGIEALRSFTAGCNYIPARKTCGSQGASCQAAAAEAWRPHKPGTAPRLPHAPGSTGSCPGSASRHADITAAAPRALWTRAGPAAPPPPPRRQALPPPLPPTPGWRWTAL